MRARTVGLLILYPLRCRIGSTAPSVIGLRNALDCHAVARGPVSASPSPMTQATIRSGLSNAAPKGWLSDIPTHLLRESTLESSAQHGWKFRREAKIFQPGFVLADSRIGGHRTCPGRTP